MRIFKKVLLIGIPPVLLVLALYYFYPVQKIPAGVTIDKIVVLKSQHKLVAFAHGKEVVRYTVAIAKNPVGDKQYEGDKKTPEGSYTIWDKNPNSDYHKNLGISYPNEADIEEARTLDKPTGGDIKIHGLKNGKGYIGRFHRWKDYTDGCIALTDEEMDELYAHVEVGTEILIEK